MLLGGDRRARRVVTVDELVRVLAHDGILLVQDATRPSVATSIAGAPIRGSWWGHPKSKQIFDALGALDEHADVAIAKLIDGKNTLIHRRLWPALVAIGRARAPWQLDGLSATALALLDQLEDGPRRGGGAPGKELEARLLARGRQLHTDAGSHVTELTAWSGFARAEKLRAPPLETAYAAFEEALWPAADRLPWRPRAPSLRRKPGEVDG